MAQVQFVLNSGAEIEGVIQGDPGHVATQISEAMAGSQPVVVYGLPELELSSINVINPSAIAAVRVIEGEAIPAR